MERPLRPRELQDSLNYYLYHPLAWQLARLLAKTPISPNMVSVLGGVMVVGAGIAYAGPGDLIYPWSAALGMALHMGWHVVDGADGDLARMTGKASPIGEMVDGICDYASHIILYFILGWLLHFQIGWIWANVAMWAAGLSHIVQANHVEVQKRSYQWWAYDKPWLKMSHATEDSGTSSGGLGAIAGAYLKVASGVTPGNDKLDVLKAGTDSDEAASTRFKSAVKAEIGPLATIWRFLGPNPRAIVLGLSMFAGSPLWFFIYQAVVLNLLLAFSARRHNAAWSRVASKLAG
jgi:phosphatidylglycerophosphate synthase